MGFVHGSVVLVSLFLGVHWDGFLTNGPREKHHALQIIGSHLGEVTEFDVKPPEPDSLS